MATVQIIWLILFALFVVLEAVTVNLVSVWFCTGSLVALIVSFFLPDQIILQTLIFILVSLLTLFALRPFAKKFLSSRRIPTNADANIGKTCQVFQEIRPGHFGRVRLEGQDWMAKSDQIIPAGAWCKIEAIEGVKLIVVPTGTNPAPKP